QVQKYLFFARNVQVIPSLIYFNLKNLSQGHNRMPCKGTADIFREFMVSLYVKGKENGHVQAYAPTGAMVLK
ncbi:MAG: hypothetical protein MR712_03290, partial [Bacteroidales bacterium]|nr:hypothetical protein [Bacteroidales bacterium]